MVDSQNVESFSGVCWCNGPTIIYQYMDVGANGPMPNALQNKVNDYWSAEVLVL